MLNEQVRRVEIRFLYSEECPSHDEALERLRKILNEEGIQAEVEVLRVETFEDAKRLRYPGSPTILIDGRDIEPISNPEYAPSCRAYRLEDGRISPLPSVSMIRNAVRAAMKNLKNKDPR
jgi:hypothetical protein